MMRIKISTFEDVREDLLNYFKSKSLLPIIGSGFSYKSKALNGTVPSGTDFKLHMANSLIECDKFSASECEEFKKMAFSDVASFYENNDFISPKKRLSYYSDNFSNVVLNDLKKNSS